MAQSQTEKTKLRIAQACMELLNTTSLEALRTQDILARAGVGRSTFYRFFRDKYEVANWLYQHETEKVISDHPDLREWKEWSYILHAYMRSHKAFFRNIARYRGQDSFEEFLRRFFMGNVIKTRSRKEMKLTEEELFGIDAFSIVGARVTIEWIEHNFEPEDETLVLRLEKCIPEFIRKYYE